MRFVTQFDSAGIMPFNLSGLRNVDFQDSLAMGRRIET
jgi:hypothetical protein